MMRENYMNDPNKFINQPNFQSHYGGRDRRYQNDNRGRREGGGHWRDREERKKEYIDYDDPSNASKSVQNPERQIVSYDDLF